MLRQRASGILLHPTSLPGPYGIGELGQSAKDFVDYLVEARQTRWQILPLGPTGYGDSPYASFSSFAGNPLLISLERLVEDGDLDSDEISPPSDVDKEHVQYGPLINWKLPLLRQAAEQFLTATNSRRKSAFAEFCAQHADWLDDYALFIALKYHFDSRVREGGATGGSWNESWNQEIAHREPFAVRHWTERCQSEITVQKVWQFYFFEQWRSVKQYANERGISIIGDLPIFVAMDSADVWSSPESFCLDDQLQPTHVAGVPPDYFSDTGQRWGNPLYDWHQMQATNFAWWLCRFRGTYELVDMIRVDHFRGFQAYWSIPAGEPTATHGTWVEVPGDALFQCVAKHLPEVAILAEDLGLITVEVDALRERHGFPGMRVLQFAFDDREARSRVFLPHHYVPNCVVYTGTHDNNTLRGWFQDATERERTAVRRYFGQLSDEVEWDFIRMAMASVARLAIFPMQDVLGLDAEARMNQPSTIGVNWAWRLAANYRQSGTAKRLAELVELFDRA